MSRSFIKWVPVWLLLAICVFVVVCFLAKDYFPPLPEPDAERVLVPPFDEKEIKPASEVWLQWKELKEKTDMQEE